MAVGHCFNSNELQRGEWVRDLRRRPEMKDLIAPLRLFLIWDSVRRVSMQRAISLLQKLLRQDADAGPIIRVTLLVDPAVFAPVVRSGLLARLNTAGVQIVPKRENLQKLWLSLCGQRDFLAASLMQLIEALPQEVRQLRVSLFFVRRNVELLAAEMKNIKLHTGVSELFLPSRENSPGKRHGKLPVTIDGGRSNVVRALLLVSILES